MMKRCLFVFPVFLFVGIGLFVPIPVSAADPPPNPGIDSNSKTEFNKSIKEVGGDEAPNFTDSVQNVINILLYVAGTIAIIIIVVGSLRFVTSEGDAAAANKAKNSVIFALVGLVVAVLAYAIVNFILDGIAR